MTRQEQVGRAFKNSLSKIATPPNPPQAKREAMIAYQGWEDALAAWKREDPWYEEEPYSEAFWSA